MWKGYCQLVQLIDVGHYQSVSYRNTARNAPKPVLLLTGDQLLAIDNLHLDNWSGSPTDAEKLLRRATKLQVLPYTAIQRAQSRSQYAISGMYRKLPITQNFARVIKYLQSSPGRYIKFALESGENVQTR